MINIQNIQINKSKEFLLPIKIKSETNFNLDFKLYQVQLFEDILSLKFIESVKFDELNYNLIIQAKSLNFNYESIFTILNKYNLKPNIFDKNYPVIGMTCATCSNSVETTLNYLDVVISANVNLIENSVQIKYFPTLITIENLKESLSKIGFELIIPTSTSNERQKSTNVNKMDFEQKEVNNLDYLNNLDISNENEVFERLEVEKLNLIKKKTVLAIALSIPVAIIGMFFHHLEQANLLMFILSLPVILYSGAGYYKNTLRSFSNLHFNMDSLVGVSTGVAFIYSILIMIFETTLKNYNFPTFTYFESSVVIIAFVLIGKYIEEKAKSKTNSSIKKLLGLQENKVYKLNQKLLQYDIKSNLDLTSYIETHISNVNLGDLVLVKPGDKIPIDGEIVFGESFIDESSMTGEPLAKFKTINDKLLAGTINQNSPIVIKTQKIGEDTLLSQIISSVRKAQSTKAPVQRIVDKVTSYFVPIVFLFAFITLFGWMIYAFQFADNQFLFNKYLLQGFSSFITVLVISCPCALGLATPTAIVVGLGKSSDKGILIKDAESLELASKITDIVFDKTGTLTIGKPIVNELIWSEDLINDKTTNFNALLNVIYRIETLSTHPLANSISEYINDYLLKHNVDFERYNNEFEIKNVENISGLGISANLTYGEVNTNFYIGNLELFNSISKNDNNQNISNEKLIKLYNTNSELGKTCVLFFNEEISKDSDNLDNTVEKKVNILSLITLEDEIKSSTYNLIKELNSSNIKTHLLSGDNNNSVSILANKIGIKNFKGQQMPLDKSNYINSLKDNKLKNNKSITAMVGDGINDSTSLASADLSIAMGNGTDIAIDVAKVTILNSDLNKISDFIKISKDTNRTIKQNLFWAFIYNVISIPIATGIFINYGLEINPMIASFLMSISSISVVSNSIYLKYKK